MTEAWCGTSTRSLVALRMLSLRCLLGDGLRGEGLGILTPSWVPLLLLAARVVLECGWFLLVAGGKRGAGESGLQFVVATWGECILQVAAVWRMVLLSAVFLPRLLTSL